MRPKTLCISAWGPYKDKVQIEFEAFYRQGLFLITGATGAGKTTIFDAITYALYGALSGELRDKERSSVRSDFADGQTPTFVELTMEHGGAEYFVRRNPEYFRPKKRASGEGLLTKEKENALLRLPDGKVIEGVREVNGKIQELMGVDLQQFKQLSMIAQGEFARLLVASPKDKTKIFREIFGTGVYERFTYNLSREAKKRYQKVAEHKAKLDEDIRILAGSVKDMPVEDELKEEFVRFPELPSVPFERVGTCLDAMEKQLTGLLAENKRENDKNEKAVLKTQSLLTTIREENKRICQYQQAVEEYEKLEKQQVLYIEKEQRHKRAVGAGVLEVDALRVSSAWAQLDKLKAGMEQLKERIGSNRVLLEKEGPFLERREEWSRWIACKQEYLLKKKELESKTGELSLKNGKLEVARVQYVEQDRSVRESKDIYEEALRKRSYAAIGIAAGLLEEGKPCPVCGSLEHPSPATLEETVCSEEELKCLKTAAEAAGRQAEILYRQVLNLQAEVSVIAETVHVLQGDVETLQESVNVETGIPKELAELPSELAMKRLQEVCDRVNALKATLLQQEKQLSDMLMEIEAAESAYAEAEVYFEERLAEQGFADREAYEAAYMDRMDRDALGEEISSYKERCAAARELCRSLQEHIRQKQPLDTAQAEQDLDALLKKRKALTADSRRLEYARNEVKRCKKQLSDKEEIIRKESEEYGLIKELENIATGNNPKRLVFEQYVLASYFDEILKAANIRFRRMSSGRYEMRRAKEVSDGRVKDNLEIEVMDYYTGKPRSVRTLSGGESFKASLSLALGLSDVIQSMNGGIKVEALFIDEGFGALDSESLDQACNTLNSLVENNRLIGIISHVPELRERITGQLVIEKGGSGSSIKMIVS